MNPRTLILSTGRIITAGKNAQNNDELVRKALPTDTLLHTALPGSPFVNIGEKPTKQELTEAAIICAKYSQAWKKTKTDVAIHVFKKSDTHKNNHDKEGSWNVKNFTIITAKKKDLEAYEEQQDTKHNNSTTQKTIKRKAINQEYSP